MTAVLTFVLGYCAVSVLAACAWASLRAEEKRRERIQAARDAANARAVSA